MHGSRSKIPSKKSRQAALRGGIFSGFKGLNYRRATESTTIKNIKIIPSQWAQN
jgi:hypothetical protein